MQLKHRTSLPRSFVEPDLEMLKPDIGSVMLICLLWTGGNVVSHAVWWRSHLRPLEPCGYAAFHLSGKSELGMMVHPSC